ncbi:hypothetical protein BJ138DRAFT_1145796 [Hygrophoropsis aurantiaca]|uniref:Uncharacterized protein n=1 Tax=Hygrophoropsis aurantiaca TaxID=72124 RepID=A0ACB8AK07_9AGAM|nr:hypothetical protein BJ138DRAFT_1145796 [Hygrophoropsis aurantiaca]
MSEVEIDVSEKLLSERKHRRLRGEVISPLKYSNDIVDFDHWDHMFITNCCSRLTLHQFDGPPTTVLDLGCGRGLWAIEAARRWQGSTVVGFDIEALQPKWNILEKSVSRRIRWVQGNVLDPLPFLTGQFDFVRMVRMGLHVPEDEWQYVLEEIARVLQPGGVLEIIEEDLIFPCQEPETQETESLYGGSSGRCSSKSSNTAISGSYLKFDSSDKSSSKNNSTDVFATASNLSLSATVHSSQILQPPDPRDHSRLRLAWEEMLDTSFLAPKLLSVLPFYLSASFEEVRSHLPLQVPLPQTSSKPRDPTHPLPHIQETLDPNVIFELRALGGNTGDEADYDDGASIMTKTSFQRPLPSWPCMHLARTVRTIAGCKESIWKAYERLFGDDPSLPPLVRSKRPKDIKSGSQSSTNPLRDYFERDWINWENDMADRTSVRSSMRSELSWNEPSGKPPEWRLWRNALPHVALDPAEEDKVELCRSLRGFVCLSPSRHPLKGG